MDEFSGPIPETRYDGYDGHDGHDVHTLNQRINGTSAQPSEANRPFAGWILGSTGGEDTQALLF